MRQQQLSVKVFVAKVLCSPPIGALIGMLTRNTPASFGTKIHVPPVTGWRSTVASLFWGFYESGERRLINGYLNPELDVIELGGSLGFISSQICRKQKPGLRLIVVEANLKLIDALCSNLKRNTCQSNFEVIGRAIAYGVPVVYLSGDSRNISGRIHRSSEQSGGEAVPSITLGKLLQDHNIDEYALVCDIEGVEAEILEYDIAALSKCRQVIIELHSTHIDERTVTVDTLLTQLSELFTLVYRYGSVCVFERRVEESS